MAHSIEITPIDHQTPLLRQATKDEIEEGKSVDQLIETNQILDEICLDLNNLSTKSCTIFRVSVGLSESNPDAYKPMLVSIGPYHKKNLQLHSMEDYKLRYLQRFLRRKTGLDVKTCITELGKLKDKALKCYDGIEDFYSDNNAGQFLKMLLVDGCFIVEFIRERCERNPREKDIIPYSCIDDQVRRDLLLLENQLPFFVLTKLHIMTMDPINGGFGGWEGSEPPLPLDPIVPFIKLVKATFNSPFLKMSVASFLKTEGDAKNIKHLLQLVHMSCHPLLKKTSLTPENPSLEMEHCRKSLCWNPFQMVRLKNMTNDNKEYQPWDTNMPNATELDEAGVTFSKIGKFYNHNLGDNTSLFDIKFENGVMTIPCFEVCDHTETILRNLVAYEQQSSDVNPIYFSDFSIFMDYLIDSKKDVSLLRQNGIIKNDLGEDKRVASLFNTIGKGVTISYDFYYIKEYIMLVQHCKKPWNRMKASLKHNYFSSPWSGASTVGAVILLILTTIQTILAFTGGVK